MSPTVGDEMSNSSSHRLQPIKLKEILVHERGHESLLSTNTYIHYITIC